MTEQDEEWVALRLCRALERCARGEDEAELREAADRLGLPVAEVHAPGAAPACYVPELFYPACEPRGVIVLNTAYASRQRARAIRHEIGHHLLWPVTVNVIFARRFPLDPYTEAYLLRERIVRRAERLCLKK